ncbi:MAG: SufE family protein [Polyangiales bacterium]
MDFTELKDNFVLLDGWSERYAYLIELGQKLPPYPDAARDSAHRVHGCQSQVWMLADAEGKPEPRLRLQADSDAHIVRGLIAVLLLLFDGKTAAEIATVDEAQAFAELGLDKHLSRGRSDGLRAMVRRIRALAGSLAV